MSGPSTEPQRLRTATRAGLALCVAVGWIAGTVGSAAGAEPVSFRRDVSAVLSKAGCNMGACHGNLNGKGGFKLSLRGQDPDYDLAVLSRDLSGRRINRLEPETSLLLLKPLMSVPHEGGQRFRAGSVEWQILRDWIAQPLPAQPQVEPALVALEVTPAEAVLSAGQTSVAIQARARFADGSQRDVTRLAVYEPSVPNVQISVNGEVQRLASGEVTIVVRYLSQQQPVRLIFLPERTDYQWSAPTAVNYIDTHIFNKLQQLQLNPQPLADDQTFLRRTALDLCGILPTAAEAQRFLADQGPDKRARWIDELLQRPEYANWWALKWSDLLRNEEKTLDRKGVQNFHAWIRLSLEEGKPFDQFVREIIASRGSTYSEPASNYYRALRDPLSRAESTAQLFLGTRLQCAKCHNHPFDRWTQDDYYRWAALFARVDYKILENRRRDQNDSHEFDGEQIVFQALTGEMKDPRTGDAAPPQFLGAGTTVAKDRDRLFALADWLTAKENRQFARVLVNRVWAQLLGRGLVEPIDDFRVTNPASHPELLEQLTTDFIEHGYDLRQLIRTIANSRTYQQSALPDGLDNTDAVDAATYAQAAVKRLTAEQLLDAWAQVLQVPLEFRGYPSGLRAAEVPGVAAVRSRDVASRPLEQFLQVFGKPQRLQSCECERGSEATLNQAFELISGRTVESLLAEPGNRLGSLLASDRTPAQMLDELYWSALCRGPTPDEQQTLLPILQQSSNRRQTLEDIVWGLLNSDEFLLRR